MDASTRLLEPSAYRALLHSGFDRYYYSEESISTGFEMCVFSSSIKGKAVAVESSSTLDDHRAFAKQLKNMGYISVAEIDSDGKYSLSLLEYIANEPIDRDINNKNIFSIIEKILFKFQSRIGTQNTDTSKTR